LDHLTVLEYDEPVTQAAAGSSAFQIERQENKVFIKPLKSGVTTNLFIWTASNKTFSYELTVGDVINMNTEIYNVSKPSATTSAVDASVQMEQVADLLITRTLLGIEPIDSAGFKSIKNKIGLRIQQVFRSRNSLYIQYSIENMSARPFRITNPNLYEIQVEQSRVNLPRLKGRQIEQQVVDGFGRTRQIPLATKGWAIIAAGNRESDRAVTTRMPTPLRNRFTHLNFEVDMQEWCEWAVDTDIRPEVIAFIRFRPDLLSNFDRDANAFPSPRSWSFVSRILDRPSSPGIEHELIAGTVGAGAATEFTAFLTTFRNLPNIDAILMNPEQELLPSDAAAQFAVASALSYRATDTNFDRICKYLNGCQRNLACFACTMLRVASQMCATLPATRNGLSKTIT
jgi:hypothetical protein